MTTSIVTCEKYLVWSILNPTGSFEHISDEDAWSETIVKGCSHVGLINHQNIRGLKYFVAFGRDLHKYFGIKWHKEKIYIDIRDNNPVLTSKNPGEIFMLDDGVITTKNEKKLYFINGIGLCLVGKYEKLDISTAFRLRKKYINGVHMIVVQGDLYVSDEEMCIEECHRPEFEMSDLLILCTNLVKKMYLVRHRLKELDKAKDLLSELDKIFKELSDIEIEALGLINRLDLMASSLGLEGYSKITGQIDAILSLVEDEKQSLNLLNKIIKLLQAEETTIEPVVTMEIIKLAKNSQSGQTLNTRKFLKDFAKRTLEMLQKTYQMTKVQNIEEDTDAEVNERLSVLGHNIEMLQEILSCEFGQQFKQNTSGKKSLISASFKKYILTVTVMGTCFLCAFMIRLMKYHDHVQN